MCSDLVLRVDALSKQYAIYDRPEHRLMQMLWRGRRKFHRSFHALENVSFDLERGSTLGIIGRNGAGKSTLLQLICGTLTPTSGSVEVFGRIAALLELGAGFNPDFTGRENARINAAILGYSPAQIDARMDDILAFADIGEFIDQPVKTYSSGMYVRLAFSVAIHVEPELLIIDEALAVGDVFFQAKCATRMKRMMDDGVSLLFISHDIAAIKALCSRVLWLDKGRTLALGPTAEVTNRYGEDWVRQSNFAQGQITESESAPIAEEPTTVKHNGTGAARLESLSWRTTAGPAEQIPVHYGDSLTILATVLVKEPCSHLVLSFHIKDRHNQHLIGHHTADHPDIYPREWLPGERFTVRFTLPVFLHEGAYSLTGLISSIEDIQRYTDASFLDWVEDASVMRVLAREAFPLSDLVELPSEISFELA